MSEIGDIKHGLIPADKQLVGVLLDKIFRDDPNSDSTGIIECQDHYLRGGDTLHLECIQVIATSPSHLFGFLDENVNRGIAVKFHREEIKLSNDPDNV